ncbi:MAG: glutathione S-transferase family protein [Dokdonella sp.]|uniref:glutathione S-transferase family protein n=1 Tax=Dokdonella sp. TaxID=2291710 RepID=UPI0025C2D660|nr:glutathione S-transferase family protein [Dokdonella sp.]MBZ0223693.1 glutathione S-transferase family protein [Dokdonella sp.]
MSSPSQPVLFHNPHSRACMTRALLEELGIPFEIRVIDFRKDEQRSAEYLAINPMGKVPALRHDGTVVTETVAIYIYLADRFGAAKLAPALDDPDRGSYLRWLVFYAACFEPAVGDRAAKRPPVPRSQSGYGDFESVMTTVNDQLAAGPYLLGERFSAADVLWANALRWITGFKLIDSNPQIEAYMKRVLDRPAQLRAVAADQELAEQMGLAG